MVIAGKTRKDLYEPYFVLQKGPETPMFDERFHDYGMNKISYVLEVCPT